MTTETTLGQPVLGATRIAVTDAKRGGFSFRTIGGTWIVSGQFASTDDRLQLRKLTIESAAEEHLTTKSLQTIPLGVLLEAVQQYQLDQSAPPESHPESAPRRRPGRPSRRDTDLRAVAEDFLRVQASGATPVMEALARERAWPVATTRGWVRGATTAGWLAPPTHGKAGRVAGPRLRAEPTPTPRKKKK